VSGLGQTLAFLFSKGERNADKPEQMLFTQLTEHLRSRLRPAPTGDFMVAVLDLSPAAYRTATREALAVADWLKRFAEGRLESEES
jgi:CRISPR-associated protein Cmr5